MPAGGRGYTRPPSLVSLWSTAPFLLNNTVGPFESSPSVEGRMRSFQASIEQMLWPEKREKDILLGDKVPGRMDRTTVPSYLRVSRGYLPEFIQRLPSDMLIPKFFSPDGVEIGPIPTGTPIGLLANLNLLFEDPNPGRLDTDAFVKHQQNVATLLRRLARDLAELPANFTEEQAREKFRNLVLEVNVAEAYERGARGVLRLYRSADEEAHAPTSTAVDRAKWTDGVIFVGTWMPERGPLLASLLEAGVPLSIHGDGWRKAAEWPVLQPSWRGPALYGEDYVKAIRHARVCLGLLSKGNRDLHTQRSMEIPFAGGLLCAERTSEHRALYAEDEEAVFWEGPQECAARCLELLADDTRGRRIAEQGRRRAIANAHLNEQVADRILCEALR